MFSQYLKFNKVEIIDQLASVIVIFALVVVYAHPLKVIAEDVIEEIPVEETAETIDTGDASAETEVVNQVNINELNLEETAESGDMPSTDVSIENEAEINNNVETEAETGENEVEGSGEEKINTGNAYASANVVSLVNFNLVESNGFLYLLNNFLESMGHVDLRLIAPSSGKSLYSIPTLNSCGTSNCNATTTDLSVEIKNQAEISNAVIVRSSTGENTATSTNNAGINTGDAYAGANVVNIANTNIINSDYLLFAFNNFSGWDGDLILPNADFFSSFFSQPSVSAANISHTNSAGIENNVTTSADTGGNVSEGEISGINTGDAVANTNVTNIANTNIFNSSTFFVVFRIFGAWNGSVFNAPEGVSWVETPSGIELFSNDTGGSDTLEKDLNINTNNTANINNNVQVIALTGENKATSIDGEASINTGNAYAGANIINIANTNIVSSNWIVALINIFGDWSGSISFGQPDIWVATQVEAPNPLLFSSELVFHTTVANRGDASASKVKFEGHFSDRLVRFDKENLSGNYVWNIGDLKPGEVRELTYTAKVGDGMEHMWQDALVKHDFNVSAYETDANYEDNSDTIFLPIQRPVNNLWSFKDPIKIKTSTYPSISVNKTSSKATTTASSTIGYTIKIQNSGGTAFKGVLHDILEDEKGEVIAENNWELGEILQNEEISVSYEAIFNASTTPGMYTNYAWVEASGKDYKYGNLVWNEADSNLATTSIVVIGDSLATNTDVVITNIKIEVVEDMEYVLALLSQAPKVIINETRTLEPKIIAEPESTDTNEPSRQKAQEKDNFNPWLLVFSSFFLIMRPNTKRNITTLF